MIIQCICAGMPHDGDRVTYCLSIEVIYVIFMCDLFDYGCCKSGCELALTFHLYIAFNVRCAIVQMYVIMLCIVLF